MNVIDVLKDEYANRPNGKKIISDSLASELKFSDNKQRLEIIANQEEKFKKNKPLLISLGKIKKAIETENLLPKQSPAIQESVKVDTSIKEKRLTPLEVAQGLSQKDNIPLQDAMQKVAGFPRTSRANLKGDSFPILGTIGDILSATGRAGVASFSDKPFLESMAEIDPDLYNADGTLKHWSRRLLEGTATSPSSSIAPFTGFAGLKAASKIPGLAGSMLRQKLGRGAVGGAGATLADMSFDEVTRPEGFPMMTLGDYGLGIGLGAGLGALGGAFNKVTPKSKQAPISKGSFQNIPQRISNKVDNVKDYGIKAKNFVTGRRSEDPTNIGAISGEVSQGAAPSANNLRVGDEGYDYNIVPFESPTNTALAPNLGPGNTLDGLSTQALENPNNIVPSSTSDIDVSNLSPVEYKAHKKLREKLSKIDGVNLEDISPDHVQHFAAPNVGGKDKAYINYDNAAHKKANPDLQNTNPNYEIEEGALSYAVENVAKPAFEAYKNKMKTIGKGIGKIRKDFLQKGIEPISVDNFIKMVNDTFEDSNVLFKREIVDGEPKVYAVNRIDGEILDDADLMDIEWAGKIKNSLSNIKKDITGSKLSFLQEKFNNIISPQPKSSQPIYSKSDQKYIALNEKIKDLIDQKISTSLGKEKAKEFKNLKFGYSKMIKTVEGLGSQLGKSIYYRKGGAFLDDLPEYTEGFAKGEGAVKRIVSSATDQGANKLWQSVRAETGYNVHKAAAYALHAGKKYGDNTARTLLGEQGEINRTLKEIAKNPPMSKDGYIKGTVDLAKKGVVGASKKVGSFFSPKKDDIDIDEYLQEYSKRLEEADKLGVNVEDLKPTPEFKLIQDFVRMPAKGFPQEEER